jgi:chromate transporter
MILLELFYTFLIIGLFTFGGGYSMIALIQNEVVDHHAWLSMQEFTDILAISQMTPGPIGINTATYAGYTAVVNAGYPAWMGVGGAAVASFAVIMLPVALIIIVSRYLLRNMDNPVVAGMFRVLRMTIVGLIAAAALSLMPTVFAPTPTGTISIFNFQFSIFNLIIFLAVFALSLWKKMSPILLILLSGLVGLIVYYFV